MSASPARVWRAATATRWLVAAFALVAGVCIPLLGYLIYRNEHDRVLPGFLGLLTLGCLVYAWLFGLRPRLTASPLGVTVVNPLRRVRFNWSDITVIAPGENGLVIGSRSQLIEAWCIQKSTRGTRKGWITRADRVATELLTLLEKYDPLPADQETGLRIRRARPDESRRLMRMERAASEAHLGHLFPPERYPYPVADVVHRWRRLLRDRFVRVELLELHGAPVGYLAYDAGSILHLGVVPHQARRGYGSALLEHATQQIFAGGATQATLWVLAGNTAARAFYRAHDWLETNERRDCGFPPHPPEIKLIRRNPAAPRRRLDPAHWAR